MTVNPAEQIFEEMLPYLEIPDAQTSGSQLLKDKGITINAAFADYAQPADNPINVENLACGCGWNIYFHGSQENRPMA